MLDARETTERFFSFARITSEASRKSASLPAVTLTSMLEEAKPPCAVATASSPSPVIFFNWAVTVACSLAWSAAGLVVSEKMLEPPPENAARSELPPDPMVRRTVSTPFTLRSTVSTFFEATSCASRLVPRGRVWVTVSVFCPLLPMKFVFRLVARNPLPANTTRAATITRAGNLRVQRMTGRYTFCSRVVCSNSSAPVEVPTDSPSACRYAFLRLPRNQYASTGTIVSETNSDASRAIVTVMAKGRNSSPVSPPTSAIGKNTATVVIVEAVTAVATSRTAVRMAGSFSSPRPMCLLMFSITTMESSTTRPIAMVSAASVMMLSV